MAHRSAADQDTATASSIAAALLGYLERYFAWRSDHRLPWVPLTVSATWKWMQALKDASHFRISVPEVVCSHVSMPDFFSSPLFKGSATHSLQAPPRFDRSRPFWSAKSRPRPFNTSEVNAILAKIAKPVPTSRSLKATCLSWVAKAGVSPPLRKLLGYHVDATELSVNTYSRDLLAPPLRELVRVLSLIALGAFSPDTTRSGYFAFNDPGTQDGNDAASAVLPQPPSASVSADTTAVTAESALGPTSPLSPRASVVPESTEEDLGDPAVLFRSTSIFIGSAPEVADNTYRRRRL